MDQQIITSAERAATEPDAGLTGAQVSQLTNLLRAAADLERAQRPIYLVSPAPVAGVDSRTAPDWTPPAAMPSGVMVAPAFAAPDAPLRRVVPVRHWGVRLAYASLATLVAGAASGVVLGTAAGPVGMVAGGIVGAVVGTARAVHEQEQEGAS